MARATKAELEQENTELRERLSAIYDELGEVLGVDNEDDDESDDEGEEDDAE